MWPDPVWNELVSKAVHLLISQFTNCPNPFPSKFTVAFFKKKNKKLFLIGTEEVVQYFRALPVLPEDPGFKSHHLVWQLTVICYSSFK